MPWTSARPIAFAQKRTIFMTPAVFADFNVQPWPRDPLNLDDRPAERRRNFHGLLERFVAGQNVVPDQHLKLLRPAAPTFANVWEFRSMPPDPQTRLIGYFVSVGCFLALWFGPRRELDPLIGRGWNAVVKDVHDEFDVLFPGRTPLQSKWPVSTRAELARYINA